MYLRHQEQKEVFFLVFFFVMLSKKTSKKMVGFLCLGAKTSFVGVSKQKQLVNRFC